MSDLDVSHGRSMDSSSWEFDSEDVERIEAEQKLIKLPRGYGSSMKKIVQHLGWLKAHDFLTLGGPLGKIVGGGGLVTRANL